jgi:hypothetical protein
MRGLARHLIGSNKSNVRGGSSGDPPFVEMPDFLSRPSLAIDAAFKSAGR